MTTDREAMQFWSWIKTNEAKLRAGAAGDPLFKELLTRLHNYNPKLYFEIGGMRGQKTEFIITAEGDASQFKSVYALVDKAPVISGWEILALKPAHGFDFVTQHEGARIV